jgi:hypothetical protein
MVLSMLATPFIIMHSNRTVMKLVASEWLQQSLQMTNIARKSINTNQHVIICGYGRCGQNLARTMLTGALAGAQTGLSGIPRRFLDGLERMVQAIKREQRG